MKESIYDRATKKIEQRLTNVMGKIDAQFANTKAYDTKVVTPKEKIYNYLNMTPEQKMMGKQEFGTAFDAYEMEMQKLMDRNNMNKEVF